jgi:hypothetical protein
MYAESDGLRGNARRLHPVDRAHNVRLVPAALQVMPRPYILSHVVRP